MIQFAPEAQYTAIIDDWGPYYIERIQEVMDGTWEPKSTWAGLAEGHVVMAPYTNLPDDVVAMAKETEARSPAVGSRSPARSPSKTARLPLKMASPSTMEPFSA